MVKLTHRIKRDSLFKRRLALIVAPMLVGGLSLAAVAFADTITGDANSITTNIEGTVTKAPGESGSAKFALVVNDNNTTTDPVNGCNAGGGNTVFLSVSSNKPWLTVTPSTISLTACDTGTLADGLQNAATVNYSVGTGAPAGETATVTAAYQSGGRTGGGYTSGNFTVQTPSDTTAPVIEPTVTGTLGDNDWYTSNVKLTWSVSDPESAISSQTGCGETNITSDQQSVDYTCSATSAGGTSSKTVSIKRDASAPNPACGTGPSDWQANNVLLGCTATDVGPSGLANSGDASFQLSTTVAEGSETNNAQTDSRTVKDSAGNSATIGPFSFMVDRKAPTVSCDSPAPSFLLNESPANVTGTAADGGSGPASQNLSKSADTSSVGGGKTVTLTASDAVGNEGSASCAYSVGYKFEGFYTPVDNGNVLNSAKAGQAIPLKWRLLDANNNPVTSLSSVKVTVTSLACALGTTQDGLEEYAAGSSGLQNLGNGYYQFNWKSPTNYASSCKTLNLDLGEGSPRTALFKFTR